MLTRIPCAVALAGALVACSGSDDETPAEAGWQGQHVTTLDFAADDNSEVIKLLPDGSRAVLIASKTRRVTLLAVTADGLTELRSANLFGDDGSESELTHIDFDSQGRFAAITRTKPISEGGVLTDCQGSLVFVDVSDSDAFGAVLAELAVGPMPDTVDISPDDRWVVTGDEKDHDDKCGIDGPTPSVTLIELPSSDPTDARVRARIDMVTGPDEAPREPEQIIFAADSDLVAATLQDSHEVMFFRLSELLTDADADVVEAGSDTLALTTLPQSTSGADAWPDGLAAYTVGGETAFVVTGEYNDVIYVLGADGTVRSTDSITDAIVPSDFPRGTVEQDYVRFRPDSVDTFEYAGRWYAAVSIKLAGAVGVWDITDPSDIYVASMVKVGFDDTRTESGASSLGTEGISARAGVIVTANEGESSASLVAPLAE